MTNGSCVGLRCSPDDEGVELDIGEFVYNGCHVGLAGHVRVAQHALGMVQRVSHVTLVTFNRLVLPSLLEWIVGVECRGGGLSC